MALKKKANLVEELDCEDVFAASEAEKLEFEDIFAASGAEVQQQIADREYWRQKVGVRKASNVDITKEDDPNHPSLHATEYCTHPVELRN